MRSLLNMIGVAMVAHGAYAAGAAATSDAQAFDKDDNYGVFDYKPAGNVTDFKSAPPANALYRNPAAPIEDLITDVVHVGSGCEFACTNENAGAAFDLPSGFKADANADVFMIKR